MKRPSRRVLLLAGGICAATVGAAGAGLLLRGSSPPPRGTSRPPRRLLSVSEIEASFTVVPGVSLEVTVETNGEQGQRVLVSLVNEGESLVLLPDLPLCSGGNWVHAADGALLILSVGRYRLAPRTPPHALLADPVIVVSPGQSFRESLDLEAEVRPCTVDDRGKSLRVEPDGLGGPLDRAIVAYDLAVVEDTAELFMDRAGWVLPRSGFLRWTRIGAWVDLARPVEAKRSVPRPRRVVLERPPAPPMTESAPGAGGSGW